MLESNLLSEINGYIDGSWCSADDATSFSVTNPATGELLAEVPAMGPAECSSAAAAAERALANTPSLETRREWLEAIDAALRQHQEELGRILTLEHGKPHAEGQGEVLYAAGFFAYAARNIDALAPRTLDEQPRNCTWTVYNRPAGAVALITPWNFPIGMIAKKLSASLAAGAPAVIKPSAKTPLTMVALFNILDRELNLPPGMVNLVTGAAGPIGDALLSDPRIQVISFTGSTGVGQELIRGSAEGVKRLALELGGNAPFIVFADADLEHAADQLIANKFRGGGQTCVCANRILVESSVMDSFAAKVAERAAKLTVGNGMEPGVDLGPLIDRSGYEKVRRHYLDALDKGATTVMGKDPGAMERDYGAYFPPTVVSGVTPQMACWREETFGPLVPMAPFEGEADALAKANDTEFGLASYLFTGDDERAERLIPNLQFPHVGWNTGSGPTPEAPFGGMKHSGFGREGGLEGLFEFVETQTVPRGPL
ncbi:aldehyde dehydrogenase family protein [Halorhodospira halochloris]|uniref:Aldehyde dehydrogenase n=1 Tax=Halorhodospira halochloris TaxID=1052 RepID=A0A110B5J9_HALHR|nr:aldehyde dehydrogenase family protein [Halorhodospira halochloris]MBK1652189.1 NAD-dependent succinate-semialdehyde dehydrogenase [Halorhodospira halochloris]MCG5531229.1 aldehyde dehydrogenase family protein [Halorhodospira halochloris]MCG5547800.1 aldehyde dehydrogenase family protein [Halorhodospira halochloris]BAU58391.1 aldehyde dehydrogenase [Halorhodospira halochloris]